MKWVLIALAILTAILLLRKEGLDNPPPRGPPAPPSRDSQGPPAPPSRGPSGPTLPPGVPTADEMRAENQAQREAELARIAAEKDQFAKEREAIQAAREAEVAPTTSATSVPVSAVTESTTGGTSGIAMGPDSGGVGGGQTIWGPQYTEMGLGDGAGLGSDTTSSRKYPILLGPNAPASTLSPAGIVPPSKSWQLTNSGVLPSPSVLGSIVPGDKDFIPDPYRLASSFTASTYSSKTEPVPFLTDFSAFQK